MVTNEIVVNPETFYLSPGFPRFPPRFPPVAISPTKGLLTVLLFLGMHFLEGNVITPLLTRSIVRLPPALTMTAQLLLAVIAGPLGLALAAPFAAATLGVFDVLIPIADVPQVEKHKEH